MAEIKDDSRRIFIGKAGGEHVLKVSSQDNIKAQVVKSDGEDNFTPTGTEYTASKKNSKKLWEQRIKFDFGEDPEYLTEKKANKILGNRLHRLVDCL